MLSAIDRNHCPPSPESALIDREACNTPLVRVSVNRWTELAKMDQLIANLEQFVLKLQKYYLAGLRSLGAEGLARPMGWAGAFGKVAERRAYVEDPQTPTNGKSCLQASLFERRNIRA
jgi:hypothetical protein